MKIPVGSKIKFMGEKQRYTVQASNVAFLICTKPFNPRKTVLYCIVDLIEGVRGPEDLIFGMGAETKEECEEMLVRVTEGESEVSHRHRAPLHVEAVYVEGHGPVRFPSIMPYSKESDAPIMAE